MRVSQNAGVGVRAGTRARARAGGRAGLWALLGPGRGWWKSQGQGAWVGSRIGTWDQGWGPRPGGQGWGYLGQRLRLQDAGAGLGTGLETGSGSVRAGSTASVWSE